MQTKWQNFCKDIVVLCKEFYLYVERSGVAAQIDPTHYEKQVTKLRRFEAFLTNND